MFNFFDFFNHCFIMNIPEGVILNSHSLLITSTTVLWDQELAAVLKPLCTERGHFSMCIGIYTQGNTHSNPRDFGSETNTQQYMTIICMSVYLR